MEKAALQKILEAEKKADGIISEGIREARNLLEESAVKIKGLKTEFGERLDDKTGKIVNKRIKEAEIEAAGLEESFIIECNEIKNKASINIDKAVAYVVEKIGSGTWQ